MFNNHNNGDVMIFDITKVGRNFALSRNFQLHEAQSKCGSNHVRVHWASIGLVQSIRDEFQKQYPTVSIIPTRWYSTAYYNKKIGGADESTHLWGGGLDIVVRVNGQDIPPLEVAKVAKKLGAGGVKAYEMHTHVDVGRKRTW